MDAQPWPAEIRLSADGRHLSLGFDDGRRVTIPAELLRVESPSAEVQGHGPGEKKTIPGKREIAIARIEPVGNYAVRLVFDDGHDTGLYSWTYLDDLGRRQDELMRGYLDRLAAAGLPRT